MLFSATTSARARPGFAVAALMYRPGVLALRLIAFLALLASPPSNAAILEEVIEVPVTVRAPSGRPVSQTIMVTVFRDARREKSPYLVLIHGRPVSAADFPQMGRLTYAVSAGYFAELGFVVLVPTRIGYGETGGPDVEASGPCENRNFAPAYAAAADQALAVVQSTLRLAYVDSSRGAVVGESFGGMVAIALAARGAMGLRGAVNFSGGGGGNPTERPGNPCGAERLAALYRNFGATAKVPTLWLYSANDRFWGPDLPRRWFDGFVAAGGRAQFVQLPARGSDGHDVFAAGPGSWKAAVEAFLRDIGLL